MLPATTHSTSAAPRWAVIGLSTLLVTIILSGCLSSDPKGTLTVDDAAGGDGGNQTNNTTAPTPTATPTPTPTPTDNTTSDNNTTSGGGGNNTTTDDTTSIDWGDPAAAKVRPGVQTTFSGSQCTSNFVYHSPSRDTYYLGSAAHCFDKGSYGDAVTIKDTSDNTAFTGTLAYVSWIEMGLIEQGGTLDDGNNANGDEVHLHDFALIAIPDDALDLVHPAALHWGGPTGLADTASLNMGSGVIAAGNSGLRNGVPNQADRQEGFYQTTYTRDDMPPSWDSVVAYLITPTVPGDSGSGLMTSKGEALGVASIQAAGFNLNTPTAGVWWEYSPIPDAVAYANEQAGFDLELVTWDLL